MVFPLAACFVSITIITKAVLFLASVNSTGRNSDSQTNNTRPTMSTYKAVQVSEPGKLQLVELPIREPGRGQVRLRVEACGVCHSDSGTVEGLFPISWPRVPGHEVVGRIYGGKFDAPVRYLDPTILYPVTWSDKMMEDEIFGPLLPILTYADLGTLLAKIKSGPKPLAGYVFSRNQRAIDRVLQSLSFGGGAVNQTNVFLFIESMPYGGVGTSGIGNYYGKYGYDSLTHAKSVLISPPDVAIDHLFPPYTKEKVQAMDQWFDY